MPRDPHCGSIRFVRAENSADRRVPVAGHSNKDGKWLQRRNYHRDGTRSYKVPRAPKRRPLLNRRPRAVLQADPIKTTSQTQVKLQPAKERLRMPGTFKVRRPRQSLRPPQWALRRRPPRLPALLVPSPDDKVLRPILAWALSLRGHLTPVELWGRVDIQICAPPFRAGFTWDGVSDAVLQG